MSVVNEFESALYEAAEQKIMWYNSLALPKMLENYRTFHSAVKNMISIFEKKMLLSPDPYKKDKRVVDISIPAEDDFPDSEGPAVLGIRLSDYESSLDFLCNYVQFSVDAMQPEKIKKLFLFNSFIDWNNLTKGGAQSNNRYFGSIITSVKTSTDNLSAGLLSNMLSVVTKTLRDINNELKSLTSLQRQLYKIDVRKNIFDSPSFLQTYNNLTVETGLAEVRKVFPSLMEQKRLYPDLIEEIIQEDFGPQKDSLREEVLKVFQIVSEEKKEDVKKVDTRALIFDVLKILQAFAPSLETIQQKIQENHDLLQSEKKTGFAKLVMSLRAAFGLKNPTVEYKIKAVDMRTQIETIEVVDYSKFVDGITQKIRLFSSLGAKNSPVMAKLENESEESVLEYVQKRINECQDLFATLSGFDGFFKTEVAPSNRPKVKGIKIDLDVIKNTILKANKYKAEYVSTVTTEEQMKKLGITNE